MSRAFVKDDDDRPEPAVKRTAGDAPNYVTAAGLGLLQESLASAREAGDARNADYFEERIASAIVDDPAGHVPGEVAFGATVTTRDERGKTTRVRIVGEDEADPARGSIGWSSPYAQALLGHRAGDRVVVHRPAGPAAVAIETVEFE